MSPSTVYSNQYLSFLQCQMAKRLLIQYACGPTYSGLGPWDWFDSIPQLISICWDDRRQALLLKRFNWHLAASETTRDDSDAQKFFHRKVCKLHDFSKDFFICLQIMLFSCFSVKEILVSSHLAPLGFWVDLSYHRILYSDVPWTLVNTILSTPTYRLAFPSMLPLSNFPSMKHISTACKSAETCTQL